MIILPTDLSKLMQKRMFEPNFGEKMVNNYNRIVDIWKAKFFNGDALIMFKDLETFRIYKPTAYLLLS